MSATEPAAWTAYATLAIGAAVALVIGFALALTAHTLLRRAMPARETQILFAVAGVALVLALLAFFDVTARVLMRENEESAVLWAGVATAFLVVGLRARREKT